MTKILHLTLHREFFAAIAAGKKRTEYREAKPYWQKRPNIAPGSDSTPSLTTSTSISPTRSA
jgi:hypothetical protein